MAYVEYPDKNVDTVTKDDIIIKMIKSFKHKGPAELFQSGRSRRVKHDLQSRSLRRLEGRVAFPKSG